MLEFAVDHVTVLVRSSVPPSVYVPVALNACVVPRANEGFAGVTAMETSAGAVTVSVAVPEIEPEVALIPALPIATPCASPDPLTVATDSADVLHATEAVRFFVAPFV